MKSLQGRKSPLQRGINNNRICGKAPEEGVRPGEGCGCQIASNRA